MTFEEMVQVLSSLKNLTFENCILKKNSVTSYNHNYEDFEIIRFSIELNLFFNDRFWNNIMYTFSKIWITFHNIMYTFSKITFNIILAET